MQIGQDAHPFLVLLGIDQPPRRLGEEQRSDGEDGADHGLHEERDPPREVRGDERAEVVEPLCLGVAVEKKKKKKSAKRDRRVGGGKYRIS